MNRRHWIQGLALTAGCSLLGQSGAGSPAPGRSAPNDTPSRNKPDTNGRAADVLVVGAGASGIPAAIAAARQGARVILVEEDFVPGGAPVDMFVAMLCGGPRVGIYRQMAERLNAGHDLSGRPTPDFNVGLKNY